jgi:hypothetical protein
VIEDPFGKNGGPKYLGATTPVTGGSVEHLSLGMDGKLYADVLMNETLGGSGKIYKSLFVWDAANLIAEALNNQGKLTTPIDSGFVKPARYDGISAGQGFGWTYGIGTYTVPGRTQTLSTVRIAETKPTALPPSIDGNFITDYYGFSDAAMQESIANAAKSTNPTWLNAAAYAAKYTVYTVGNFLVNGAIDRSAHLTQDYVNQKLSFTQYATSMTSTVGFGLASLVAAGRVATLTSKAVGMGLWGEAAGSLASSAAYTFTQKTGDIVTYQLSDGKAGKSLGSTTWTEVTTDVALGAGLGMLPALLGRVPYINGKIMWNSPSVESSLRIRLVQPVMLTDARGFRFTLADSTGGDILATAGGKITRGSHSLDIPAKGVMTFDQSVQFLDDASAVLRALLDDKASLREQAFQAAQLSNSLLMAARNGLQDANLAARLNFTLPPSTFKQIEQKYAKDYSGDALYKKIITDAEDQLHRLSCFVAGTLVHTKEGLHPIEQIKVGDYVLSKPESGEGEPEYKRVTKTFESDEQEVWFVSYMTSEDGMTFSYVNSEPLVVTGSHPIWVVGLGNTDSTEIKQETSTWVSTDRLFEFVERSGGALRPIFELQDGRRALWNYSGPVLRTTNPQLGIVYMQPEDVFYEGIGVDFSKSHPEPLLEENNLFKDIPMDIEPDDYVIGENCILSISGGYHPMLHKVYNLEVEDNHTYYVGAAGVLVHNTCSEELATLQNPKFSPADALPIFLTDKGLLAEFKAHDNKGIAVAGENLTGVSEAGKIQGGFDGAISDPNTGKLYAYVLGYVNSVGGRNYTKLGDAVAYLYQNGKRVATNFLVDVKAGIFGVPTDAMKKYIGGTQLSTFDIKGFNSLIKTLKQRSLALEQYNGLGHAYAVEDPAGVELFSQFLRKAVLDKNLRTVPTGTPGIPAGVNWSFDDWFNEKIIIGSIQKTTFNGSEINTLSDKVRVFKKVYGMVDGKREVVDLVWKDVDKNTVLKPLDGVNNEAAMIEVRKKIAAANFQYLEVAGLTTNPASNILTQADIAQLIPAARQYWLNAGASAALLDTTLISIGNLPAGVAGQTLGNQITLSADGAGWGWFVDPTPMDSLEFINTSSSQLIAPADSAASGKLDLLTVLIHELGHRLGLAHDGTTGVWHYWGQVSQFAQNGRPDPKNANWHEHCRILSARGCRNRKCHQSRNHRTAARTDSVPANGR